MLDCMFLAEKLCYVVFDCIYDVQYKIGIYLINKWSKNFVSLCSFSVKLMPNCPAAAYLAIPH